MFVLFVFIFKNRVEEVGSAVPMVNGEAELRGLEAEAEIRKGTNKIRAKKLPGDRAQV